MEGRVHMTAPDGRTFTFEEWCDRKYNMNYGTWKERRKAKIGY